MESQAIQDILAVVRKLKVETKTLQDAQNQISLHCANSAVAKPIEWLPRRSGKCFCCSKTVGSHAASHPLWPADRVCQQCQQLPRCVVCERRCAVQPYYLNREDLSSGFSSVQIGQYKGRNPLFICPQCAASGTIGECNNSKVPENTLQRVLLRMKSNPSLRLDFSVLTEPLEFHCCPIYQVEATQRGDRSVQVELVDIHHLSHPKPTNVLAPDAFTFRQSSSTATTIQRDWGEQLVFGRCESLEHPDNCLQSRKAARRWIKGSRFTLEHNDAMEKFKCRTEISMQDHCIPPVYPQTKTSFRKSSTVEKSRVVLPQLPKIRHQSSRGLKTLPLVSSQVIGSSRVAGTPRTVPTPTSVPIATGALHQRSSAAPHFTKKQSVKQGGIVRLVGAGPDDSKTRKESHSIKKNASRAGTRPHEKKHAVEELWSYSIGTKQKVDGVSPTAMVEQRKLLISNAHQLERWKEPHFHSPSHGRIRHRSDQSKSHQHPYLVEKRKLMICSSESDRPMACRVGTMDLPVSSISHDIALSSALPSHHKTARHQVHRRVSASSRTNHHQRALISAVPHQSPMAKREAADCGQRDSGPVPAGDSRLVSQVVARYSRYYYTGKHQPPTHLAPLIESRPETTAAYAQTTESRSIVVNDYVLMASRAQRIARPGRCLQGIAVAENLPEDVFCGTLAHELTHAYIFATAYSLPELAEEGLCNAVSMVYLLNRAERYGRVIQRLNYFMAHPLVPNPQLEKLLREYFPMEAEQHDRRTKNALSSLQTVNLLEHHGSSSTFNPYNSTPYHQHMLLRDRLTLRQKLCVYRFRRMLIGDILEYLSATLLLPVLLRRGLHTCLEALQDHHLRRQASGR